MLQTTAADDPYGYRPVSSRAAVGCQRSGCELNRTPHYPAARACDILGSLLMDAAPGSLLLAAALGSLLTAALESLPLAATLVAGSSLPKLREPSMLGTPNELASFVTTRCSVGLTMLTTVPGLHVHSCQPPCRLHQILCSDHTRLGKQPTAVVWSCCDWSHDA